MIRIIARLFPIVFFIAISVVVIREEVIAPPPEPSHTIIGYYRNPPNGSQTTLTMANVGPVVAQSYDGAWRLMTTTDGQVWVRVEDVPASVSVANPLPARSTE